MSVTLIQTAASIKDPNSQEEFIEKGLKEPYSQSELRAMAEGKDPEDADRGETVHKEKCPTCGSLVRAELL